jgi:hypothetical protein
MAERAFPRDTNMQDGSLSTTACAFNTQTEIDSKSQQDCLQKINILVLFKPDKSTLARKKIRAPAGHYYRKAPSSAMAINTIAFKVKSQEIANN